MFQNALLKWYHINHRKLPWRESSDPYRIWLSEIMLQQTQVVTVIDYYNKFVDKYPDVYAMAEAEEEDVFKLWEGLGYYSRAGRLIPCAKKVVEEFDGIFPKDYKALLTLPGIGDYTAGAIASIAYNEKVPAVDGNVMRVYSRLFEMDDDLSKNKTKKVFFEKVMDTLPEDRRHFNQALMELGATVCTPKKFQCEICPIQKWCKAYTNDTVDQFPVKTKKIKQKVIKMMMAYITCDDECLIIRNDERAMLKGLWGFPQMAGNELEAMSGFLKDEFNIDVEYVAHLGEKKHVFTHQIWEMTLIHFEVKQKVSIDFPVNTWSKVSDFDQLPWSIAQKKLWSLLGSIDE